MARIAASVFLLGTAIGVATQAPAQDPAPAEPSRPPSLPLQGNGNLPIRLPKLILLRMPPVQAELKMTEAQKQAVSPPKVRERFRDKIEAVEAIQDRKKRSDATLASLDEIEAALLADFEPWQRARLDQIQLQLRGPWAFLIPGFQKWLGLSVDQVEKIRLIVEEWKAEMKGLPSPCRPA